MSRAQGKKTPRQIIGELLGEPGGLTEGEAAQLGIGPERDIPGGLNHIGNPPVPRFKVPVPEQPWPYRNALLAHGVDPDEAGHHDRDPRLTGGGTGKARPKTEHDQARPSPVPVYIVEQAGAGNDIRTASPRSIQVPASTSAEPARVAGLNPRRNRIGLLNEDTATDIRFGTDLASLSAGTGALLPWPNNSYVWLETQGELFAIGATGSGTPRLSIIEEYSESAAS